jgi:hypothetical protein
MNGIGTLGIVTPPPSVPASGVTVTNGYGLAALIRMWGGALTQITVNGQALPFVGGLMLVAAGETITLTYTLAPSWSIFLLN